jgi:hypothetical protein
MLLPWLTRGVTWVPGEVPVLTAPVVLVTALAQLGSLTLVTLLVRLAALVLLPVTARLGVLVTVTRPARLGALVSLVSLAQVTATGPCGSSSVHR